MNGSNHYWLYRLIDDLELTDSADLSIDLSLEPLASRVIDIAEDERQNDDEENPFGNSIVAGSTMDLSGLLTCIDYNCRIKQVDRLFGKTAHYFDSIVVEGKGADDFMQRIEMAESEDKHFEAFDSLSGDIRMLMHLRAAGLDSLLVFREKPYRYCARHARKHATELGLEALFDASVDKSIADRVLRSADIHITETDDNHWHTAITDTSTGNTYNNALHKGVRVKKPTKRHAVEHMLKRQAGVLVSDFALSRELGVPLAQEGIFQWGPASPVAPISPQLVALELDLPYLGGLSTPDLLKLRQDEHAAFESFQAAIAKAMHEQIAQLDSGDPRQVARAVVNEYVRPELAQIERRFHVARRTMGTKTGLTVAIGSLLTSVGFASAVPLIATTGVAAAATAIPHINSYFDKKSDIQLSDMYFLWRAGQLH